MLKAYGIRLTKHDSITHVFSCNSNDEVAILKTVNVIRIPSPSRQGFRRNNNYNAWKDLHQRKGNTESMIEFLAEQYRTIFGERGFDVQPPYQPLA